MNEIHKTHIKSTYLEKAAMKKVPNLLEPDWELRYYPGPKARQEFAEAAKGHKNKLLESNFGLLSEGNSGVPASSETNQPDLNNSPDYNNYQYFSLLLKFGINEKTAKNLIVTDPQEVIYQLSIFDSNKKYSQSPAAYLVWAIKNKFRPANAVLPQDIPSQAPLFENEKPTKGTEKPRKFTDEPCPVCYGAKMQVVKGKGARVCRFCVDEKNRATGKLPIEYDEFFLDKLLNGTNSE